MIIGKLIKEKRIKLGLSQKELSDKLNISIQRLNNFENNERTPSLTFLGKLSKILNFDINNLSRKNKDIYIFSINLFCERLSNYRKEKNYSLEQLGNIIEVSRQTLSKWEKGESYPNINDYYQLCKKLKVKPSFFICNKTQKKKRNLYPYILGISIPIILSILILINGLNSNPPSNNDSSSITQPITSSSSSKVSILETSLLMNDNTITFINEWSKSFNETYKDEQERPYTIYFNDPNIEDIDFYYGEEIFLPMYFGKDNFIDAYYITDVLLLDVGLQKMNFDHDINLRPSYKTYEQYLNSIIYIKKDDTIYIDRIYNSSFFIIPDKFDNCSKFEINNFFNIPRVFISNYSSNLIFNGENMDEIPRTMFINSKSIEFVNCDLNIEEFNIIAIKQHTNYEKSSNFISCNNIRYLYIDSDDKYDNFIIFNASTKNILLNNFAKEYKDNFIGFDNNSAKKQRKKGKK